MTFIENAVTIEEIARVTKGKAATVEAEAREVQLFVGVDWASRPALSTQDAWSLVSGAARRGIESSRRHFDLAAKAEAWLTERARVVSAARTSVQGGDSPANREKARELAEEAGRAFERKVPADIRDRVSLVYLADAEVVG